MNKEFKAEINLYYRLMGEATQLYEKWAKQRGITYNTILVLCTFLSEQGACTQKQICDKWNIPKQTVHTILKDFERKGYVAFPEISSRKNKVVSLTDSGLAYANKIADELYEQDFRTIGKMGIEHMKALNLNLTLYIRCYREAEDK